MATRAPSEERPPAHRADPPRERVSAPLLVTLVVGYLVGAGLIVLAYRQAQHSTGFGHFAVFWIGVLVVVAVTVAGGLRLPAAGRSLPLLLLALGLITFLPKLLMSPAGPIYFDEFAHVRHAQDVLATGDFGVHNDLLPVIQYYPGLSATTLAVHYVTTADLWHSGQIVIGAAHCACLLLVFFLARRVGLSSRAAFFAGLVYAANPGFLYFDTQYAYESLAMAFLLGAAVCCAAARQGRSRRVSLAWATGGFLLALATVLTHHISSAVMAALCVLIALFLPATGDDEALRRTQRLGPWLVGGVSVVVVGVWNLAVSAQTRAYLLPSLRSGFAQLLDRVTGSNSDSSGGSGVAVGGGGASAHTPFSGSAVPSYETPLAYAVPVLVTVAAVFTVVRIWRSADRRDEARRAAPFGVLAVAYLGSLPLALTATGNQVAHRSWPFFFIGVAVFSVWTFGRAQVTWPRRTASLRLGPLVGGALAVIVLMVINIGDVSAGANVAYRFPGPYEFGQDHRFESRELTSVVRWSARHLPAQARVVTDRFTSQPLLVGSTLHIATNSESYSNALYLDPDDPSDQLRGYLRAHHFRYFILDRRIVDQDPVQVFYQSYEGLPDSSLRRLADIRDNAFIQLLHRTQHYAVYRINP